MRISDWSSDVCSSEVAGPLQRPQRLRRQAVHERPLALPEFIVGEAVALFPGEAFDRAALAHRRANSPPFRCIGDIRQNRTATKGADLPRPIATAVEQGRVPGTAGVPDGRET